MSHFIQRDGCLVVPSSAPLAGLKRRSTCWHFFNVFAVVDIETKLGVQDPHDLIAISSGERLLSSV